MNLMHSDFQLLFDALFGMSKTLLDKQGAFLPIGAIVLPEGKVGHVAAYPEGELPGAHKALELLEGGLRLMATKGKCRAAGMAIDTRLKAAPRQDDVGKDAIWIILEERTGQSQGIVVPYAKSLQGGFTYFSAFTQPERPRIFLTVN
jgi:hypothetical protein